MTSKIVKFDREVYQDIKLGVDTLSKAVSSTMGPKGKTVLIEQPNAHPLVTKDGATVAKHFNLSSKFQNLGVQVVKEAAQRSADEAGDGTTTATVLSQAIFEKGLQMIAAGKDPILLKKGIENATIDVLNLLKSKASNIKDKKEVKQIAMISCNSEEEIADIITNAIDAIGVDGSIIVENAKGYKSDLTIVEGIQFNRGYLSPYLINDEDKMTSTFENCLVLLCNARVESLKDVIVPLEKALENDKQILLIVDDIDDEALQGIVMNKLKGNLRVCVIKSPGFGNAKHDMIRDLACITGATIVNNVEEFKNFKDDSFGSLKKVIVARSNCLMIAKPDRKEHILNRIENVKNRLEAESFEKEDLIAIQHRLSQLSGGVAILRVGGSTEAEMIERRDRVDDALSATRAALQEGIIPGGGVALASCSKHIKTKNNSEYSGYEIIRYACCAPIRQIVKNTGKSPDLVVEKIHEVGDENYGYDASTGKFGNMYDLGVIDPLKVVRCALQNASSAASLLLTSECAMVNENIKQ